MGQVEANEMNRSKFQIRIKKSALDAPNSKSSCESVNWTASAIFMALTLCVWLAVAM